MKRARRSENVHLEGDASRFRWLRPPATTKPPMLSTGWGFSFSALRALIGQSPQSLRERRRGGSLTRSMACRRSASLTMLYRSNIARVQWPLTCMATRSGTPARTMFRTAVRRRSWKSRWVSLGPPCLERPSGVVSAADGCQPAQVHGGCQGPQARPWPLRARHGALDGHRVEVAEIAS